jgi:hypothetical protein
MNAILVALSILVPSLLWSSAAATNSLGALNAIVTTGGTLVLDHTPPIVLTNTLEVLKDTFLWGGYQLLSGNKRLRLFNVHSNVTLTLRGIVLVDGLAQGSSSADSNDPALMGRGGCVFNDGGTLMLTQCSLSNSCAIGGSIIQGSETAPTRSSQGGLAAGGAIYSQYGQVTLEQTRILNCTAQGGTGMDSAADRMSLGPGGNAYGGAVAIIGGSLNILDSGLGENTATGGPLTNASMGMPPGAAFGGAVYASNTFLYISNSLVSANEVLSAPSRWNGANNAACGGGVYIVGSTSLIAWSTLGGNQCIGSSTLQGMASGGGALFNSGPITLRFCRVMGNSASGSQVLCGQPGSACGGAIYNSGDAMIELSWIGNNNAKGADGSTGSTLQCGMPGSALGGSVYNAGQLILDSNTFSSNSVRGGSSPTSGNGSALGGAIYDTGFTRATNNTFYANAASVFPGSNGVACGGAIGASNATVLLVNDTLATNSVKNGAGGGLWNTNSSITVQNTILANLGGNAAGSLIDGGNNISSDDSCRFTNPASMNKTDPRLAPFGYYYNLFAALPDVFLLTSNSPAIDHGNDAVAPATDQRGHQRPYGKASDIGAIESSPPYAIGGNVHSFWDVNVALALNGNAVWDAFRGPYDTYGLLPGQYHLVPSSDGFLITPSSWDVAVEGDIFGLDFYVYKLNALSPELTTNGTARFVLAGQSGDTWTIQVSTNMVDWKVISRIVMPTNGLFPYTDSEGLAKGAKFFRAYRP